MIKKIAALVAVLTTAIALSLAGGSPVTAGTYSEVWHAGDDSGYTAPIHIKCENNTVGKNEHHWLEKGAGSPGRCGAYTSHIIVGYNQAVRCTDMTRPWEGWLYFTTGWHYVDSFRTLKCYMQRPI